MKKITILFSMIMLSATLSFGQDNSTYKESVKQMMDASGAHETYKAAIAQMIDMVKKQNSNIPGDYWDEFAAIATKSAGEDLLDMLVPVYQKHMTEADIKGLTAFYLSPVGKKFAEKTPLIMKDSMLAGQTWATKIMEQMTKQIKEKGY